MEQKPAPKTGFARVGAAFFYSLDGLRFAISHESAFRQEAFVVIIAAVLLVFLPFSSEWKGILLLATVFVLIVELLNTAVEAVVDIASPDYHLLAKRSKDLGSAAVLLSITLAVVLWGYALLTLI